VIVPSLCYENFPKAVVEAYAVGTPVVAAAIGALGELVEHETTGLLFAPGQAADLARQVRRLTSDDALAAALRRQARQRYLDRYTAEQNYQILMAIYEGVQP
jgi:glycosyltransferase involved in cell wall biosynthesis